MNSHPHLEILLGQLGSARPLKSFPSVLITSVNSTKGGDAACLAARVRFLDGEGSTARPSIAYPMLELWEEIVPSSEVMKALGTMGTGELRVGQVTAALGANSWQGQAPTEFWPTHLAPIPCYIAFRPLKYFPRNSDGRIEGLVRELDGSVVASRPGGPHFVSMLSAAASWFGWPRVNAPNDSCWGQIEVVVPLRPGQIRRVREREDGSLFVELEPGRPSERLRLHVAWNDAGSARDQEARAEDAGFVMDKPPKGEFSMYVYEGDSPVGHYRTQASSIERPPMPPATAIRERIRQGEGEQLELKDDPGGLPSKWEQKYWDRILRTVAAFANTAGGTIVLGVSDDAEITGFDKSIAQLGSEDADKASVETVLRRHSRSRLQHAPALEIQWMTVEDRSVVVIEVPKNKSGVVTGHPSGTFIRKGSSNRQADVSELNQLFQASTPLFPR